MDSINISDFTSTTFPPGSVLPKFVFTWYDYVLFSSMLIMSALIGIYFGCFGKKQSTPDEYLLGDKNMSPVPVAMSLVAGTISGIMLLAVPADIFRFGTTYWFTCVAIIVPCFIVIHVYLPVFFEQQTTSTYEYLKRRFDTRIRLFASFLYGVAVIIYLPIVIYVPALALAQATSINIHLITPLICGVCIFYTTIGGLKAVVWTDMLQFSVTIGSMIAVLYIGVVEVGGIKEVFQRASNGKLLEVNYDIDPTTRDSLWAMIFGYSLSSLSHTAISQSCVQKFLSVPTFKDAKKTLYLYLIGLVVIKTACVLTGLIMYARYYDCDPFVSRRIEKSDQLLPYYVLEVASQIPGLPGLFIAGVFCAALSTLSATMNCVAGTIYEDFVSRFMPANITPKRVSNILKLIVIIVGIVSTSLVFVVQHMSELLPLSITFSSITHGPLLGLFSLGMLCPKANSQGAFYGTLASFGFMIWLAGGAQWHKSHGSIHHTTKPASTAGCNYDFTPKNITIIEPSDTDEVFFLYRITHFYFTGLGAIVGLIVGNIVSYFTRNENDPPVDKGLLSPVVHFLLEKDDKCEYNAIPQTLHILSLNGAKDQNQNKNS